MSIAEADLPSLAKIRAVREQLGDSVLRTPVHHWRGPLLAARLPAGTEVFAKLELFQVTGTFKPRGALAVMRNLAPAALARGIVTASAGNHAIAAAYAAKASGVSAKVVILQSANAYRLAKVKALGAEIVMAPDGASAFEKVAEIEAAEGRAFVHPFEGPFTSLGTATLGDELNAQVDDLEAVIVPIGGGGLCSGVAAAVKLNNPNCQIFGVEPIGADSMHRSFAAGEPRAIERVETIADSLGAPYAAPHGFGLCRRYLDDLVLVDDEEIKDAMRLIFEELKLAVEPAAAAATAALLGPLRARLAGRRVGIVVCGSNIDLATVTGLIG